jgi:hypothetical protein
MSQDETGAPDHIAPKVRVLYPSGGEVLRGGAQVFIKWQSSDNDGVATHRVQISLDGGRTYRDIGDGLPGQAQGCALTLPMGPFEGVRVKVVALDAAGNLGIGTSGPFSIAEPDRTAPELTLLSPGGGEVLRGGEVLAIRWQSKDNIGVESHEIQLSVDGGASYNRMLRGLPGQAQAYELRLPRVATARARLRILCRDGAGNAGICVSEEFTIRLPDEEDPAWP